MLSDIITVYVVEWTNESLGANMTTDPLLSLNSETLPVTVVVPVVTVIGTGVVVIVDARIGSVKVMLIVAFTPTFTAPAAGLVRTTSGGVTSPSDPVVNVIVSGFDIAFPEISLTPVVTCME
jgi:hypothetical protein